MKKRLLRFIAFALCLCLIGSFGFTASATAEIIDITDRDKEPPTPPPPEPDAKYIITIAAPRGWYRQSATLTIKLEDENSTGFAKAEARFGSNGAWQDISDGLRSYGWAHVSISDNGTVYVSVTDKKGKAHVKSLYIECFDREAPTVKARVSGHTLQIEADDAHSGVESIFVNGYRFDDHTNGMLDIRIRDYVDKDEEEIFVYAVDYAGNRSRTVQVKNPNYSPPSSSQPAQAAPVETPPAASTAPPVQQAPAASQPAVATPPAQAATAPPAQTAEPAQSRPGNDSVTPTDGTGTVIENSVKTPEEREFFTITTDEGNDFYIGATRS